MCVDLKEYTILRDEGGVDRYQGACGRCWQCKRNKINDYVGRGLCEAETAVASATVSLTYAPRNDGAEKLLDPTHFTDFIRVLRDRGTLVRYIVAGEYGEERGRSHFHAVLFFHSQPPKWRGGVGPDGTMLREHWDEWPHGHMCVDWQATSKSLRYCMWYIQKPERGWFSLSKKPVIGWPFFQRRAEEYAQTGTVPQAWTYWPPRGESHVKFYLTGATRRDLCLATIDAYEAAGRRMPALNKFVAPAFDKAVDWRRKQCEEVLTPAQLWKQMMRDIKMERTQRDGSPSTSGG